MTPSDEKALPCPFCGKEPKRTLWWDKGLRIHVERVRCLDITCHARPYVIGDTKAEAISRWNVRAK